MTNTVTNPCTNPYGPESGDHTGPADHVAVLYRNGDPSVELMRTGPRCLGHAQYEERWRAAAGMGALARVEQLVDQAEPTERELVAGAFGSLVDAMADAADPVAAAARRRGSGDHSPTSDDQLPTLGARAGQHSPADR